MTWQFLSDMTSNLKLKKLESKITHQQIRSQKLVWFEQKGVYFVFIFSLLWNSPLKNLFDFVFVFSFHSQYPKNRI